MYDYNVPVKTHLVHLRKKQNQKDFRYFPHGIF